jgi:hypothetical protein
MLKLDDLINAAKKEDWGLVDKTIPEICNKKTYVEWAYKKGLKHTDDNVRDLAASILEKTRTLNPEMKTRLYYVMKDDSNFYAKFRAACALAAHAPEYHAMEVKNVLKKAEEDKGIKDIAKGYLKKYNP